MRIQILQTTVFAIFVLLTACTPIIQPSPTSLPDDLVFRDFIGDYSLDDIFGSTLNLSINPDKTFDFKAFFDSGGNWEQVGTVEVKNGTLHLAVLSERQPLIPNILVPVKWGERRYLIEAEEIESFCENVNKGNEPRNSSDGFFYLKDGDWNAIVSGIPISTDGKAICP